MEQKKRHFRVFLILWIGEMIASIGSGLTSFGLNVYVFRMTENVTACSAVVLCGFLPIILLNPFAGLCADRFNRRLLMFLGDSLSAVSLTVMLVFIGNRRDNIFVICLCVFLSAAFASLTDPAYQAAITDLLTVDEYSRIGGLMAVASAAKFLISPALAGIIMENHGIELILMMDIGTLAFTLFSIVYANMVAGKEPQREHGEGTGFLSEFMEGWNALSSNRGVMTLLLVTMALTFYVGFLQTLMTPMLLEFAAPGTIGNVTSIAACGMIFSGALLGAKGIKANFQSIMSIALIFAGIFMCVIGGSTNIAIIGIAGFGFFASLPLINTCIDTMIRSSLDSDTQGRAWGLISMISQLGYVGAYAVSGPMADYIFNPMLRPDGRLAPSIGKMIGVGKARGTGFLLVLCGLMTIGSALFLPSSANIKQLEVEYMKKTTSFAREEERGNDYEKQNHSSGDKTK